MEIRAWWVDDIILMHQLCQTYFLVLEPRSH
jgi:hypothetical protein